MSNVTSRYPRTIQSNGVSFELTVMHATDEPDVLRFARTLPTHDMLFMRRDITNPKVLSAWVREINAENIVSVLARVAATSSAARRSCAMCIRIRRTSAICACWCRRARVRMGSAARWCRRVS